MNMYDNITNFILKLNQKTWFENKIEKQIQIQ